MRRLKVNRTVRLFLVFFGFLCFGTVVPDGLGLISDRTGDQIYLFPPEIGISSVYAEEIPSSNNDKKKEETAGRRSLPLRRPLPPSRLRQKSYAPGSPMQLPPYSPPLDPGMTGPEPAGPGSPVPGMSDEKQASNGPIHVVFENGKVRILAENRTFNEVIEAMSREMGFKHKIPAEVGSRKVSISLYDVPLDRAIIRLFSLVQEKNYKVKFSDDGNIANIEVVDVKSASGEGNTVASRSSNVKSRDQETSRTPKRRYQPYRPPSVRPRTLPSRPPSRRVPSSIAEPPPLPE